MFKKLLLPSLLVFSSLITIYPSRKENTNLFNYCYGLEKIISRNSLEKSKNYQRMFSHLQKILLHLGPTKLKELWLII